MSVSAVLAYRWDGKRCRLYFQMRGGSYDAESLIRFLKDLKRHLRSMKVILIWDGLPGHRSRKHSVNPSRLTPAYGAQRAWRKSLRRG